MAPGASFSFEGREFVIYSCFESLFCSGGKRLLRTRSGTISVPGFDPRPAWQRGDCLNIRFGTVRLWEPVSPGGEKLSRAWSGTVRLREPALPMGMRLLRTHTETVWLQEPSSLWGRDN